MQVQALLGAHLFMYRIDSLSAEKCRILRKRGFTLGEISQVIKLPKTTVYDHVYDIPLSMETKERIKRESTKRINEYIRKYRKGKCMFGRVVPKPVGWSPELIFITSHFMFDGLIRHRGCEYYNRNNSLLQEMRKMMKKLFNLDSKIYKRDFGVKQIRYYYVELGDYIKQKALEILNYIKTGSFKEKKIFLKSFFDDEGSIHCRKRLVRGYQDNLAILKLVQNLLKDFNIESKIDKRYKEIIISRKANIIKFRDKINFSKGIYINPNRKNSIWKKKLEKRKILNKITGSYKK